MSATFTKGMGGKFELGQLSTTPGALEEFGQIRILQCLTRHANGDWGDLSDGDNKANDRALSKKGDDRILSSYKLGENKTLWIITEADRSTTTALLPEEY